MAAKRGLSSFANSSALKTAMVAKGIYPPVKVDDVLYESANDIHLVHGQGEDGWFRTTNLINNALSFDWVDPTETNLVRAWSVREMYIEISRINGVQSQGGTLNGSTWTYTIVRNGTTYSRTASQEQNACCLAFTDLVNAL